jgi:hypothetical protein
LKLKLPSTKFNCPSNELTLLVSPCIHLPPNFNEDIFGCILSTFNGFFSILWCWHNVSDHPKRNLAAFCYRPTMKTNIENPLCIGYNVFPQCVKNGDFSDFFPQNLGIKKYIFHFFQKHC